MNAQTQTNNAKQSQPPGTAPCTDTERLDPKNNRCRKSRTHSELKKYVTHTPKDIVYRLNPTESVNIVVGESGEGKTPLWMQKAICVAAGIPFLEQQVQQGRVLWVDFENGEAPIMEMMEKIATALGLDGVPENVHVLSHPASADEVLEQLALIRPVMVIVDALRGYDSDAEQYNSKAGKMLTELYRKARQYSVTWDFVHHTRKLDEKQKEIPSLQTTPIRQWLLQASGSHALINQTVVRVGVESVVGKGEIELIVRGFGKVKGEFGPWYIARIYPDGSDEAIGYRKLSGVNLLAASDRDVFLKLPAEFTHKELVQASGKAKGKAQTELVRNFLAAGLVTKHGEWRNTVYKKTEAGLTAKSGVPEIPSEQQLKAFFANWKPEQKYSLAAVQNQFKNHGLKSRASNVDAALHHAERMKWIESNGPHTGAPQVWWRTQSATASPGAVVAEIQAQKGDAANTASARDDEGFETGSLPGGKWSKSRKGDSSQLSSQ